jgi:hypothetical protein
MRCLYCDRKLSLVKSLKGETFCSPAHQDLYRQQNAAGSIERIVGSPEDDARRAARIPTVEVKKTPEPVPTVLALEAPAPPEATFVHPPAPHAVDSLSGIHRTDPVAEAATIAPPVPPRADHRIQAEPVTQEPQRRRKRHHKRRRSTDPDLPS